MKKNLLMLTALLISNVALKRGEGETTTTTTTTAPASDGRLTEAEWEARSQAKHAKDSHADLIRRVGQLEHQNQELSRNQVPQGARVLTKTEAANYDAYVALGKPDEIQAKLAEGEKNGTELSEMRFKDSVNTAATDAKYKSGVLSDRIKADGLTVLPSKEEDVNGQKVRVPYVKDAQGVEHKLTDYATKNWGDYLPALQGGTTPQSQTTTFSTQQDASTTTSGGGGGSWVQQSLANQAKGGTTYQDPLRPAQPAAPAPAPAQ